MNRRNLFQSFLALFCAAKVPKLAAAKPADAGTVDRLPRPSDGSDDPCFVALRNGKNND